MGVRDKKARAQGTDGRAGSNSDNINTESITHTIYGSTTREWFKMLYPSEMKMLYARGASRLEMLVYCVLTHYGKPLEGDQCHVPAATIAEALGVPCASVRRAEGGLIRKGIIERVQGGAKGHVAVFRVRAEAFELSTPAEPKRNDMVTQTAPKRNDVDTHRNFWRNDMVTLSDAKGGHIDTPNTVWCNDMVTH